MKDIFVADLHCDKKRKVTYGDPDIWNNKPLELLAGILEVEKPNTLTLLGDVFDTATPDSLSYGKFIATIINVPNVWILEGNHDRPKVEKDYAFQKLSELPNVSIVPKNTLLHMFKDSRIGINIYGIGWCDTQEMFESVLLEALGLCNDGDILCLHCNWDDWGNEMDNSMPNGLFKEFEKKGILILSGHEHTFHDEQCFIHLGAIMPMTIGELGRKTYYVIGDGLKDIDHGVGTDEATCDVLLLREEPITVLENRAYYIKSSKEVSIDDIQMESKDLKVDILSDFIKAAVAVGFDEKMLREYFNDTQN